MPQQTFGVGTVPLVLKVGERVTLICSSGCAGFISVPGEAVAQTITAGASYDYGGYSVQREVVLSISAGTVAVNFNADGSQFWTQSQADGLQALVSEDGKTLAYGRRSRDGSFALPDAIVSPLDIPNCELWLDAASGAYKSDWTRCTADGDAVAYLADGSGNARHATNSGTVSYKPTGGYNGRPGVLGKLLTPGFLTSGMGQEGTWIVVTKAASSGSGLKLKVSGASAFWIARNVTTGARDMNMTGLTGTGSSNSNTTPNVAGIEVVSYSVSGLKSRVFGDGVGWSQSSSESVMTKTLTGGAISFSSTVVCVSGLAGNSTYDWPDPISEVLFFSRYLSDSEIARLWAYLAAKYETAPLVVCLGNSLTSGTSSTGGPTQPVSSSGTNWPSRLQAALGSSARVMTDAYPGRTSAQILSESQAYSALVAVRTPRTVSVVWEYTNTLATANSAEHAYDQVRRICISKRNQNAKVAVMTCLLRGDSGNDTKNAALTAELIALIRASWSTFADALIDVAADSRLSNFNDSTYFDTDKTHLKDAGYQVVADLASPVVLSLLTAV